MSQLTRAVGRRDDEGDRQLPRLRRADPGAGGALARPHQGRRRARERRARPARPRTRPSGSQPPPSGSPGRARRPVPDRRLPDRLGHLVEHERERGDRHPRRRGRPPERRRQHGPVVERRLPLGRAPRRARRDRARPAARARRARRLARGEGRASSTTSSSPAARTGWTPCPSRSARSSAATQRRCARAAARVEDALPRLGQIPLGGTATGTGLNTHPEFAARVRAMLAARDRAAHLGARRPVRGAGRPRRHRRGLRRAQDGRRLADEDRQRHPLARLRPPRRGSARSSCPSCRRAARSCRARSTRSCARSSPRWPRR